jgi:hypothetical protein
MAAAPCLDRSEIVGEKSNYLAEAHGNRGRTRPRGELCLLAASRKRLAVGWLPMVAYTATPTPAPPCSIPMHQAREQ